MVKIVVAGNATIDAIVSGNTEKIGNDTIAVTSDGTKVSFRIEDPPIRNAYKHRVNQNISQIVEPLWHRMQPGGGGYNSVTAMRHLSGIGNELELHYIDVSIPHHLIAKGLGRNGIIYHFFFERDVPVNAIIGVDGDRVVVKGYQLSRVEPDENKNQRTKEIIDGSDSILLNSVKDKGYMECYLAI